MTSKGSVCVYPHRALADSWDSKFRELRVTADLGYKCAVKLTDFTSPQEVGLVIKDSNVVICTIGSNFYADNESDFEESNIFVP